MRPTTRSSSPRATASRTRAAPCGATYDAGPARRAATSARWSRRCGARSTRGADGIAVSIIDPRAFNEPTAGGAATRYPRGRLQRRRRRGNRRLAYIGQDLYQSGLKFGARIVELVGRRRLPLHRHPGQLNIQPRIDGALDAIKDSGKPIRVHVVATGPDVAEERAKIEATYLAHRRLRGMFAVDGGSTAGRRPGHAQVHAARAASAPAATTCCRGRCARSATATSTSRSTSSPTSRASCRSSSSSFAVQRRARRAGGHEHGAALRHPAQREAVPDDPDALRGQLAVSEYPVT